jgi:hypothetical protein
MWVREPGGELNLAQEPISLTHAAGHVVAQHLDGDVAAVPEIVRQIHNGHAACAELPEVVVATGKRSGEPIAQRGHQRDPTS